MNRQRLLVVVLGLVVVISALAVVDTQHRARALFVELQQLEREQTRLETEWGQLQLEQSTWAAHGRIERIAREELDMKIVEFDRAEIVILP